MPDRVERDTLVKRRLYAENGVREYWIVDPANRTVEALALLGPGWPPHGSFKDGESLSSPSLPDLELRLGQIF